MGLHQQYGWREQCGRTLGKEESEVGWVEASTIWEYREVDVKFERGLFVIII